jgi:hypothetical protein
VIMHCALVPNSCAGTGSAYVATFGSHSATSRHGAPAALARQLVEAGIPDGPVTITYDGLAGCLRYRSLHALAGFTYSEGNSPLRRVPFVAREAGMWGSPPAGTPIPQAANDAVEAPRLSVTRSCEVCGSPVTAKRTDATLCSPACKQKAYRERKAA